MLTLENQHKVLRLPLTPLIDVVFILLLFFMLSSSFVRYQQMDFDTAGGGDSQEDPKMASLIVEADGRVRSDGSLRTLSDPEFARTLQQWKTTHTAVIVTARSDTAVQQLVDTLDHLRQAGLTRVSLSESF